MQNLNPGIHIKGNSEVKFLFSSSRWKQKLSQDQIARVGAIEILHVPNCPFENIETPH
jgi:hypothetical protein